MGSKSVTSILIGLLVLIAGIILTSASFTNSGNEGSYRIFYGAIIYGIYKIAKGIYEGLLDYEKQSSVTKQSSSDAFKELGLVPPVTNEQLLIHYKNFLNNYNRAIQTKGTDLSSYKQNLRIYKSILAKRNIQI